MDIQIAYATLPQIKGFHEALSVVAQERIYIETLEAPPLEKVEAHHGELIANGSPVYYALQGERVVGWCDITPNKNPRLSHRGGLGMGLLPEVRGHGLGSRLLSAALAHAKAKGLEKVELLVYTSNQPAIALYKKFGFEEEGLIRKFRKLEGQYFDCLSMAKFL